MAMKTSIQILHWAAATLFISLFTASILQETCGFSLQLIPRTSMDPVLFPKNFTLEQIHSRIVQLSIARAFHLRMMTVANSSSEHPLTLQPPITHLFSNLYVTQMYVGSNRFSPYLLVDTGSDEIWFQCEGCVNCFPISRGNFSYSQSRTYRACACAHPLCIPKLCHEDICLYSWLYMGDKLSRGVLSSDNFTFHGERTEISFPNFVFGCGLDNQNIAFGGHMGPDNVIAGIFGLGSGPRSILCQLETETYLRFSYCLPSWTTQLGTFTFLRFGVDAQISGDEQHRVQTTRMVSGIPRYYVYVIGISINGYRLEIDPALFELKPDGSGGFAIDSGCGPTLLVPDAYNILRKEMVQFFQQYGWQPWEQAPTRYDLCYSVVQTGNCTLPSMTIHFQDADFSLDSKAVFQTFSDGFCMIIASSDPQGPNLLGAFQQADHRFLFDIRTFTMSFVQETCHEN